MEANTKAFWEKDAAGHMGFAYQYGKNPEVRYPMYEVRRNLVFETLNAMPKGKILDAGCGAAHVLAECLSDDWDGYGFDFAEAMVELGKKELADHGYDPERVRQGLMSDLSHYASNSFDVVLLLGVSQYLMEEDDEAIWSGIHRILKPNGIVLIDFVNSLFDLTTFNKFTVKFAADEVLSLFFPKEKAAELEQRIAKLVTYPNKPDVTGLYSTRRDHIRKRTENPLTVAERMKGHGFALDDNRFFRLHAVPPLLFETDPALEKVAIEKEGVLARHWIGHFIASAFLATLKKV
ncbi:methyltransferase domain-containing protein [Rhodoferax saidenbachensis]|uniref:SAM-dependent methyltransferase n=1 Tax=Rhodoferax saidenbachensis TaxID=1484693 RepID=A0ABU1ZKH1_9BURK|nr:methyltransferase domain-containing protein [Rhodoferax saidenbachensis]MDR7306044.1 SAM-dependent methyltransferase [Rhodoferax saidenbachensis]